MDSDPGYLRQYLTSRELTYCRSKRHIAESAAVRIAAKQAGLSLFGIPAKQFKNWFFDIEIQRKQSGKPVFRLSSKLKRKFKLQQHQTLMLSLAHERELAIVWVALTNTGAR